MEVGQDSRDDDHEIKKKVDPTKVRAGPKEWDFSPSGYREVFERAMPEQRKRKTIFGKKN